MYYLLQKWLESLLVLIIAFPSILWPTIMMYTIFRKIKIPLRS